MSADNLEGPPPTDEERRENWRCVNKLHRGNRFRLMFGQPLLDEKPSDSRPATPDIDDRIPPGMFVFGVLLILAVALAVGWGVVELIR